MKKKTLLIVAALLVSIGLASAQNARVQVIHNSADDSARTVDVYLNDSIWIDDFVFRTATPFLDVKAGGTQIIGIAPNNSVSVNDTMVSFTGGFVPDATYVVVVNGIMSDTGYTPSPPLTLHIYDNARESSILPLFTDVLVMHGATDAPVVDIEIDDTPLNADNIAYGEFSGYWELPTADYTVNVTDSSGITTIKSFQVPLKGLGLPGQAIVTVASGFLDPSVNNNGPEFGLWVATPMGGPMVQLSAATAINTNEGEAANLELWPNPVVNFLNLNYYLEEKTNVTIEVMNITGQVVKKFVYNDHKKGSLKREIDMSDLNAGMYFINIKTPGKVTSHKINKK